MSKKGGMSKKFAMGAWIRMKKGFVFSIDALLAVLVLMAFLAGIYFLSAGGETDNFTPLLLKKQAGDLLAMLDRSGELAGMNQSVIGATLNLSVRTASWRMEFAYYNYSSGFVGAGNASFGHSETGSDEVVMAQREFLVMQNASVKYYGIAKLKLWAK